MKLVFHHPEPGLLVTVEADTSSTGHHGAQNAGGLGAALGYPLGIIGPNGYLTRLDGSDYTVPEAAADAPEPPMHRLTVWKAGRVVRVMTFRPEGGTLAVADDIFY